MSTRAIIPSLLSLVVAASAVADVHKVPSEFPTIQAAVNAASPGDVVEVDDGLYFETVVVNQPDISIIGDGAVIDAEFTDVCIDVNDRGVRIEGLKLVNGIVGIQVTGDDAVILDNEVESIEGNGIDVVGRDAVIKENRLAGIGEDAIEYFTDFDFSETRIEKNEVDRANGAAVEAVGGRLTIRKNKGFITEDGIEVSARHPTEKSQVSKNELVLCQNVAVDVDSIGAGVIVKKNDVRFSGDSGVLVEGDGAQVTSNDIEAAEDSGIRVTGDQALIAKNDIKHVGNDGIRYTASSIGQSVIRDNEVELATEDAIRVVGSFNEICDNELEKNFGDGIDIQEGDSNRVLDNECERNAHEGIDNSGTNTRIDDNECEKNASPKGPDIAGTGNLGVGTVASFKGNDFKTGGKNTPQRLDND